MSEEPTSVIYEAPPEGTTLTVQQLINLLQLQVPKDMRHLPVYIPLWGWRDAGSTGLAVPLGPIQSVVATPSRVLIHGQDPLGIN